MGVSSSLIASAIYYWITEHQLIPALLIAGAGVAGFLITHFLTKKKPEAPPPPPPPPRSVDQDVKQEVSPKITVNPTFNVGTPVPAAAAPARAPAVEAKRESRHNIRFLEVVYGANEQTHVLSHYAGQTLTFATAKFLNEAIKGQELLTPTVKARVIYRGPYGATVLDISNVPWVPGPGNQIYETFEVNTPKYLLLFSLGNNTRFARTIQPVVARVAGGRRMVPEPHDYEIKDAISSVEVQLLTDREQVYAVRLEFADGAMNTPPLFRGYNEL